MIPIPEPIKSAVQQYSFAFDSEDPYLDFTGGGGVMPLGHADPYVADAIKTAAGGAYMLGPADEYQLPIHSAYQDRLLRHFPEDFYLQFFGSESDALWAAVETVRDLQASRGHILVVNRYRVPFGMMPGIHRTYNADAYPIQEYGGILVSPIDPDTHRQVSPELLSSVLTLSREKKIPIIWDETVTGFGWAGKIFTCPDYADYVVLGGALGGGLPLAALGGRELLQQWETEGRANTFSGSALAYAAGDRTLRRLEEEIFVDGPSEVLHDSLDRLEGELDGLCRQFPDDLRGLHGSGMLRGIVFRREEFARRVQEQSREDGLLVARSGSVVRVSVPLIVTPEDVVEAVGILFESIMKVRESDEP